MNRDSKSSTLYLFTYKYPYGPGESFLETEIEYLAADWNRVVVVPSRLDEPEREAPSNVTVDRGLARALGGKPTVLELIRAFCDQDFWSELKRNPHVLTSRRHLRRLIGRIVVGLSAARWIEENLPLAGGDEVPPLCYTYWLSASTMGLARLKRLHPELSFVARAHGYDLYAERHDPAYLPLQREMIACAERIFTISEHGATYLRNAYPDLGSRIEVARLGVVDPGILNPGSEDGRWRVLSCSALSPVKRVELLVQALGELGRRNPDRAIEWDHLGDGPLRARIETEAQALLPANVRWSIHGQVPNAEVLTYYRTRPVDVFVNVSESEGIPVSIMEAQSHGVPAAATAVGGVPEIVNSSNGALLPPEPAPAAICEAMERICRATGDGDLRHACRESWRRHYHAETNYSSFVCRLKEIQAGQAEGVPPHTGGSRMVQ